MLSNSSLTRFCIACVVIGFASFVTAAGGFQGLAGAGGNKFAPKATTVLGSTVAGDAEAFTRIFQQAKGELAIATGRFRATGLRLDWKTVSRALLRTDPILGFMTRSWGTEIIHMVIRIDFAQSHLPAGEIAVEFVVQEGTTVQIPVGTVFGRAHWKVFRGGIEGHGEFTPGLLPKVNDQAATLTFLLLPGLVKNPRRPREVQIQYEFISVDPPDRSAVLIHRLDERIGIVARTRGN